MDRSPAALAAALGDDSDSDASSVGHDIATGEPVFRNYREEQRERRAMERLGRAKGLPPGTAYIPLKRVEERAPEFTEETVATRAAAERPKVTPWAPVNDPSKRRRLSEMALHNARENVAAFRGEPPKMVREPLYGMLLPRDSIVTIAKPLRLVDEHGDEVVVAPPAVGFGLDPKHLRLEAELAVQDGTRVHYRRTVDALQSTRQGRVLQSLDFH
jgi:hypothetical protein